MLHFRRCAAFPSVAWSRRSPTPLAAPASYSALIDWGDGTTSTGVISAGSGGTFNVTGKHTYAEHRRDESSRARDQFTWRQRRVFRRSRAQGLQSVRVFGLLDPNGDHAGTVGALATADLNGDGIPDLVVPVTGTPNGFTFYSAVDVLLGNGDGTFAAPIVCPVDSPATAVAVGDFGNHHLDLAVTTNNSNVDILMGDGSGNFQPETSNRVGSPFDTVVAGDFNGDGKTDLAISGNNILMILLGNGVGTFTSPDSATFYRIGTDDTGKGFGQLLTADLRNDGRSDLILNSYTTTGGNFNNSGQNFVTVLLSNGDGTFSLQTPLAVPFQSSIAVGDLNGDKLPDLVVSGSSQVSIYSGAGDGTFALAHVYAVNHANRIMIGDMTGDGIPDLVVADADFSGVGITPATEGFSVLTGVGDGTFQSARFYPAAADPAWFVLADFNSDGHDDVAGLTGVDGSPPTLDEELNVGNGALASPVDTVTDSNVPGSRPYTVVPVDLNNDGKMDLVTTDGTNIEVRLGNGNGSFGATTLYQTSHTILSFVVGYFGKDTYPDIAAVVQESGNTNSSDDYNFDLVVLRGTSGGGFGSPTLYSLPPQTRTDNLNNPTATIAIGDVNEDGIADLVVGGPQGVVLIGKADGTFQAAKTYDTPTVEPGGAAAPESQVVLGDFNGDHHLDIAAIGSLFNGSPPADLLINFGNGNGTFQPAVQLPVGAFPVGLATADLRNDHRADLIVANDYGDTAASTGSVDVLLSNADGTFQQSVDYAIPSLVQSVTTADINGDGIRDIVVTGLASGGVYVLYGKGDGSFAAPLAYAADPNDPTSVAAADFNGDGAADVVAADEDNEVSVLLNAKPAGLIVTAAPLAATGAHACVRGGVGVHFPRRRLH